jgi:hypothetical protein
MSFFFSSARAAPEARVARAMAGDGEVARIHGLLLT